MALSSVAIIPDGNRRFSQRAELSLQAAYLAGFRKVEDVVKWSADEGISRTSFWALSLENFQKRSGAELRLLFALMDKELKKAIKSTALEGTRARFVGRLDLLPKSLSREMKALEERTRDNENELVVAVAYSGREELVNAAKRIAADVEAGRMSAADVDEKAFSDRLYLNYSPDLVIRTGAVSRLSGFLPFQAAYSELYFSKKLWPEFSRGDFRKAVEFFNSSERRFGK